MRDKLYFMSLVLHFMQPDYSLEFFCSIEKAESPCRALVTLVDRNAESTMGEAHKESLRSIILYVTVFYTSYAVFS